MSQSVVEQIIGRLVIDPAFREQMAYNREAALAEFDLTSEERANFEAMDLNEFNQGAAALDERVSKGEGWLPPRPN